MVRPLVLLLALTAGASGAARAQLLYDTTTAPYFSSGLRPARALDDGFFATDEAVLVDALNFAVSVTAGADADFDAALTFYDTLNPRAPDGEPVASDVLGQALISFRGVPGGTLAETGLRSLAAPILFPDGDWAVEIAFLNPGTSTLSNRVTPVFAGGPPSIGSNVDIYWRDIDADGVIEPLEGRSFAGTGLAAQFYLQLSGTRGGGVIPEPGTALLLCAALPPLWARKRRR